eukprot:CAMPEP_0184979644 /NCGR_PEP_ID=MMETSP1098-20130426/9845_1 /TAXON_ID=89044 /ORGANISM="Spumella elongata, Strain CCAP 955/1" /LENGTH=1009 /DNA_ID=CAMNT_0027502969 /DNA_START=107 /DNA_END=3136 /DNA_ORIENTATION=-
MSTEMVAKPTNSLPFLKESEKDYWNKLLDSNIRAGTMACMWCLKTTYVKKISWAFYSWKLNAAKESWRGNTSPLKGFAQTSSLRTPSGSLEQIDERPQNSLRPVSTVLANAISLMNQLKETDAERDLNTRLFSSPSASVKAANAMAASVLEFDSKSHGDAPRSAIAKNNAGAYNNDHMPVWEHRRRAGSGGSMDLGLFDAPDGQSAEALAAYNKQRLAYVLRSILPADSLASGSGGERDSARADYSMNLDGSRQNGRNESSANPYRNTSQLGSTEDEVDAYLRHALMSQNHDPTTKGQILMALTHNLANKPSAALTGNSNRSLSARNFGADPTDLTGNSELDAEVSARSSLSLLKTSANGSHNNLNVLKGTSSNPTSGNSANAFPRVRANSRTNSPNARTARKSLENYNNNTQGLAYNTHQNANRELPEGFYEELNTLDPRNNNHFAFPHTGSASGKGVSASSAPVTPVAGNYDQRRQSFPASAASHTLHPAGSFSGYSVLSEPSQYTSNQSVHSYHSSHTSANNSISHSANSNANRRVPGYLMPTNSFRKKTNTKGSVNIASRDKSRSPGGRMITNSNSKHITNVVNGGSYSPTGAYTVKQGMNTKRSSSAGREGYPASSLNTVNSVDSYPTMRNPDTSYANVHAAPYTTHTSTNNQTNNSSGNGSTSYANMSFLDYQARKANLSSTGSGQRSPVRRNSANIDTSRNYNGTGGSSGHHSAGVSLLGGEEENHLNDQSAPLLSSGSNDSNHPMGHMPRINSTQQHSVPPLGLSGPMLPLSLQAQQAHLAHPDTAVDATTHLPSTEPELVYEVYDSYHSSKLHSNSVDLFDPHASNTTTMSTHNTNNTHPSGMYKDKHPTINTEYGEDEGPHSVERALYSEEEPHYYNPSMHTNTSHPSNMHTTHTTHTTLTMKDTHDTHGAYTVLSTHDTPVYPNNRHVHSHSDQHITPHNSSSHTLNTNTSHQSNGRKSNPNSGNKKQPKGMDKAQRELLMFGDVHGKAPNWHKTLRN